MLWKNNELYQYDHRSLSFHKVEVIRLQWNIDELLIDTRFIELHRFENDMAKSIYAEFGWHSEQS